MIDGINAAYELIGGVFILHSCYCLFRDKEVKGVSIPATIFFTSWSIWNLYYYSSLNHWISFIGGILIVLANFSWICLAFYYIKKK